jgi:hypothetical protein
MKNILEHEFTFIEKLITFILRCVRLRKDVFVNIVKTVGGLRLLYLRRWFVWETKTGNLYLHRIVRPDDDDSPHDHPWKFSSLILWGGYFDMAYKVVQGLTSKYLICTVEQTKLFHIYHRPATHLHKVLLFKPSWSLVWVGKYDTVREWGFTLMDGTFVPWREYLKLPPETSATTLDRIEKQK